MPEITAEERTAQRYQESLARHVSLLQAFERSLRITDELYRRLEASMYGSTLTDKHFDPKHASSAVALSRALAQAGAVHARLLENEAAQADNMSDDDKRRFMLIELRKLPYSLRQAFAVELMAP
jgi:hypothetical protein